MMFRLMSDSISLSMSIAPSVSFQQYITSRLERRFSADSCITPANHTTALPCNLPPPYLRQSSLDQGRAHPCNLLYENTDQRFRKVLLGAAISCTSCPQGLCSVATKQLLYITSSATTCCTMASASQHSLHAKSRLILRPLSRSPILLSIWAAFLHTHSDVRHCQGTHCWATV